MKSNLEKFVLILSVITTLLLGGFYVGQLEQNIKVNAAHIMSLSQESAENLKIVIGMRQDIVWIKSFLEKSRSLVK